MRGGRQCQVDSETRWLILWQEDTEWMSLESSLIYYFCNDYCIFFCKIFIPSDVTASDIQLFQNFIKKLSGKKQREPVVP